MPKLHCSKKLSIGRSSISPPSESHSLTVVIPALNEKDNLKLLLIALDRTFNELGVAFPVLLIDDGSTDDSAEVLSYLSKRYLYFKFIRHAHRKGLTGVLRTALAHTTSDWLYLTPADLESDPQTDLPLLLAACQPGVDVVAGWRQKRRDGKTLASWLANFACRLAFGLKIHDMNWIKLMRRDVLATLPLEQVTYRYLLPVLAGWGYQIVEVPTPWYPRQAGKSKFGRKRLVSSAIAFLKLWWWFQTEGRSQTALKRKRV